MHIPIVLLLEIVEALTTGDKGAREAVMKTLKEYIKKLEQDDDESVTKKN